jgi:TRAP-type C4-dicarboxylate transport system permease small subunit
MGTAFGGAVALLGIFILLGNVGLTVVDVLMRWLLSQPQSWVSDVAELSYPIAIACCFPVALESGSMIAVRFLAGLVGPRIAYVLDMIGQILLAALLILFAWKVGLRAQTDWVAGYATLTLKWPVAPSWAVVSVLMTVSAVIQIARTWHLVQKGTSDA